MVGLLPLSRTPRSTTSRRKSILTKPVITLDRRTYLSTAAKVLISILSPILPSSSFLKWMVFYLIKPRRSLGSYFPRPLFIRTTTLYTTLALRRLYLVLVIIYQRHKVIIFTFILRQVYRVSIILLALPLHRT
jgi:hypothetical protein